MPSFKLAYFPFAGRGAASRMLFHLAGQTFEDHQVSFEDFGKTKTDVTKYPLGTMPVLYVDNKLTITQSKAIERYLARQFGLYGKDADEQVAIDMVVETALDIFQEFIKMYFEKDEAKKAEMLKSFMEKGLTTMFNYLQGILDAAKTGYFVGKTATLADVSVFAALEPYEKNFPTVFDKFPKMKEFMTRFRKEPKLAKYFEAWKA